MKALTSQLASEAAQRALAAREPPAAPVVTIIKSRGCVQDDFHQDWFHYWCAQAGMELRYHRKLWEHAYVLQTLFSLGMLEEEKSGLGFGVGLEPEPSILAQRGVSVLASDLNPEEGVRRGWQETHQHASSLERLHWPHIISAERFHEKVRFRPLDMTAIPRELDNQFDFCWSSCALEHLGSIRKGLDFIKDSLKPLKLGGIAVHTTEYNYMRDDFTIDHWPTVLFRRRDFEQVARELTAAGHYVYPFDFDVLRSPLDFFVDVPPYVHPGGETAADFHLRLAVDGFAATSFGIVVRKGG